MKLSALILGGALALATLTGAQAATKLVDGSDPDAILALAQGYGDADLETQSNGNPKIKGTMDGITYAIYFMNCDDDNENCEDINFYAGFLDLKVDAKKINEWNRDKRFGKAYLDKDGDAVVEWDVNLEHGVSSDNMDANIGVWQLIMGQYSEYIGFKKGK